LDNNEKYISQVKIIANARKDIQEIVENIQRDFGDQSIILQENNPSLEKRLALWSESDVLLVSSLRDGLCLPLFEYVAAKKNTGNLKDAVMLLSEFSGTNRAFNGFLEYNPFNVSQFATQLDQALSMNPFQKEELMTHAVSYLEKASTSKWVESFLKDLKIAYRPRSVYYLGE
jgi:trehalose-6-phosphate synthase